MTSRSPSKTSARASYLVGPCLQCVGTIVMLIWTAMDSLLSTDTEWRIYFCGFFVGDHADFLVSRPFLIKWQDQTVERIFHPRSSLRPCERHTPAPGSAAPRGCDSMSRNWTFTSLSSLELLFTHEVCGWGLCLKNLEHVWQWATDTTWDDKLVSRHRPHQNAGLSFHPFS